MGDDSVPHVTPPTLRHDRDPGDAWVVAETGERFWGRFGAAGLLALDPARGVLLQHRAPWSHFGGTWGIPGGALHQGESPHAGALREAHEEAGVPHGAVRLRAIEVLDRQIWRYTTVIADVQHPFDPVAGDAESIELRWVPTHQVGALDLHPAFAQAWPGLLPLTRTRPVIVVDGSSSAPGPGEPTGHSHAAASAALLERLDRVAERGVAAHHLGLDGERWYPQIDVVLDRPVSDGDPAARVTVARDGEAPLDALVRRAHERTADGCSVVVVTDDHGIGERAADGRGTWHGHDWLLRVATG